MRAWCSHGAVSQRAQYSLHPSLTPLLTQLALHTTTGTTGRGSHFILNVPPNTTGVIADGFVQAVTALGAAVEASFGPGSEIGSNTSLPGPCHSYEVLVAATVGGAFDAVVMQETLTTGQSILQYSLDVQGSDGKWTPVPTAAGQTVGNKVIDVLPAAAAAAGGGNGTRRGRAGNTAIRFKCVAAIGGPNTVVSLSSISLHKAVPPTPPVERVSLRSYYGAAEIDTAPCAFRDSTTCSTFTGAHYTLLREEAEVLNTRSENDPATKWVHLQYSLSATDNGLADGTNPKFSPPGYVDESAVDRMVVFTSGGPGRVKLDSYYSAAKKDFWVRT